MSHSSGRYPVPAVRLIVPNAQRHVLILKRPPSAFAGDQWSLPGGTVDYLATVEETARKELQEETGLVWRTARFLFYQDSPPIVTDGMHCVNFYFECEAAGEVLLNEESVASAWLSPKDLSSRSLAFRNDEALARYWDL